MTSNANANKNANSSTVGSTYPSPGSSVTTTKPPTWPSPKSPLSPHRLAKLANALGVSTPVPAIHQSTPFTSRSFLESSTMPDTVRLSPTPSAPASNSTGYSSKVSKYLLHVVPPMYLPHDTDNDIAMTPPPASASGYHPQFRRGTLVPVHSTLQSQLIAIAKEYALPSTAGIILYLVSGASPDQLDEPGPRLSENVWRHLWTRVLRAEQRDDILMPPPLRSSLGMSIGTRSTPYLPQESNNQPLRPFLSSALETTLPNISHTHLPPSPTTPSTISDLRSNARSGPPSESDPETPETSFAVPSIVKDPEMRANTFDLPGLTSTSIIPILAKVEFDIDRRKATWYKPWLRSRRLNHAKRTESRNGKQGDNGDNSDRPHENQRHIGLLTGSKGAQSAVSVSSTEEVLTVEPDPMPVSLPTLEGYEQLHELEEDPDEGDAWSDDSGDGEFESTARVTMTLDKHEDALADVFGTDAETWAEMKISSPRVSKRQTNPNIVDLALNAADLTALPSPTESEDEELGKEEDEVQALLDQMAHPTLSVSIPTSPPRSSLPISGNKKHVPPPLTFVTNSPPKDLAVPADSTPSSASSPGLAYLYDDDTSPGEDQEEGFEKDYTRVKSPAESIKRDGVVFDEIDLGFDPSEDYDETDPNDRRHSQFLMMAQLDEIERTMAQLSPRILQDDSVDEEQKYLPLSPTNTLALSPGKLNADFYPPSPGSPQHQEVPDSPILKLEAGWPLIPFASIKNAPSPHREDFPSSPSRLSATASPPKPFLLDTLGKMSEENELRKRQLQEEQGYHQPPPPPPKPPISDTVPIIPLSPDPFGRFSSTPPPAPGEQQSSAYWEKDAVPDLSNISAVDIPLPMDDPDRRKRTNSSATSRFSTDSMTGIEANSRSSRPTLMSVNTIKKLWRKRTKSTSSVQLPPIPSGSSTPDVPTLRLRASLDKSDEPTVSGRSSPQSLFHRSQEMLPPAVLQAPQQQLSGPVMAQQPRATPQSIPQLLPQELPPPVPPKPLSPLPHSDHLSLPLPTQQRPAIPHLSEQSQYPALPQHVTIPTKISVPPLFNGASMNQQPIVATQMRPGRSNSTLDRFQFDQETPYPITRRTRANSRPPSMSTSSPSLQTRQLPPSTSIAASGRSSPAPSVPPQKPSVRKSILKNSKSSSISSIASTQRPVSELGAGTEWPNSVGTRPQRSSVLTLGSSRTSITSLPPDVPPSPQIPQQFFARNDKRQSIRSRLTNSSIDSSHSMPQLSIASTSRRSMASSSHSSQESRPSFDTSQFEIVSPKMGTFSYPYHGQSHFKDSSGEER